MIRSILEFDDTYHKTFRTDIFKEQLISLFWQQSFIQDAVRHVVFLHLEKIVNTRQTFMRPSNDYVIMAGRIQTKLTYVSISDIKNEISLILSPYKNFMRWKMVPAQDRQLPYSTKPIIWDGCIGNIRSDPGMLRSLFFGKGYLGGLLVQHETPSKFAHIGDTFWF